MRADANRRRTATRRMADPRARDSVGSARMANHREHRRRVAGLDRAHHLEPVALVERNVRGIRRLEVGDASLAVDTLERVPEERRAVAAALLRRIDADERQ